MENRKPAGFTLGQLVAALVIINITAFFIYVFFSVLQQANSYARSGSCAANLKQVSLGILQYAADYDERFPFCATARNEDGTLLGWAATHDRHGAPILSDAATPQIGFDPLIGGYVKTEIIFRCPEVPKNSGPVSYMFNDLASGAARKDFVAPQSTVLVCDGEDFAGNVGHAYDPSVPPSPPNFFRDGAVASGAVLQTAPIRHNGRAAYGFADGHVRLSVPKAIYFPPRRFNSLSHLDKHTGDILGPDPAKLDALDYMGTFHIK